MPDWIAHILVTWSICTLIYFKFKQFNPYNTAVAMLGSILPDIYKITLLFNLIGIKLEKILYPLHLPIGSFIFVIIISLFFKDRKTALLFLSFGILTHYILDLLLETKNNGMYLFFPFAWNQLKIGIISNTDYIITIIALISAFITYFISKKVNMKNDSRYP